MSTGEQDFTITDEALLKLTSDIFVAVGMSRPYADLQADNLVWANLRGIDSHGVLRIPFYVGRIEAGDMDPAAIPQLISETPGTALIDARGAPGPVGTLAGVERAIEKARNVGVSWVVVRGVSHNGALAYYAERIAEAGLIAMTSVCSPPNMAPFGAKGAGLHNSPISIGIPAGERPPVVLDMATSVAAGGKIYYSADRGIPIPEGWALDASGESTTDPNKAVIWLPFQGPKGSGLAMMFECWSSLLGGNPLCAPQISGTKPAGTSYRQNAMVAAVSVAAFIDPAEYRRSVDELVDRLKSLPRSGPDEILVPGERERKTGEDRARAGIALPHGTQSRIAEVAKRYGVPVPWS